MPLPMEPTPALTIRDDEPSVAVVRQAAEWLAHIESGDASEQDYKDLEAWRSADPVHAVALDRLGGVRERLDGAPQLERETLRRLLLQPKRARGASFLGILTLTGVCWAASGLPIVELQFADQKTAAGETRALSLPDGSDIILSTDSAVDVDVDANSRTVRLLRGEILAHVAKREGALFTVESGDGTAVALGTAFTVRKEADSTMVAVATSHVRICPALGGELGCVTLAPGQRGRLTRQTAERLPDVTAGDVGAWADGWLAVDDRPLVDVLDELNLWRAQPIGFDRRALADLRVSGIFPLRDTDKAVINLSRLLPIIIDRSDPSAPIVRRH